MPLIYRVLGICLRCGASRPGRIVRFDRSYSPDDGVLLEEEVVCHLSAANGNPAKESGPRLIGPSRPSVQTARCVLFVE